MDENLIEKKISSEKIFDGVIVHLSVDKIELPNGDPATREVIRHCGAVGIIPVTEDGYTYMVRQFRYPFGRVTLEIPAGKLDPGEAPNDCAVRELSEETGIKANKLNFIGEAYSSPAILDEVLYLYLAKDLEYFEQHTDEDEFINVVKMKLSDAYKMVINGEIKDGKTQIAVLKAWCILNGENE